ncbi:Retrovirus-related Pol polyprotein from transposon RE1-like protein [Drosera capensis]
METVRMILALAAQHSWPVYQFDVKSAFLHGEILEDVYVDQPQGYKKDSHSVYKLHKALYGLKQAPRAWFNHLEKYFQQKQFMRNEGENTLFIKKVGDQILIVSVYVDDIIYVGSTEKLVQEFRQSMMQDFDMTDLGKMRYFLGLEITQTDRGIYVCQHKYVRDMLSKFGMNNMNPARSPVTAGVIASKDSDGKDVDETEFRQMIGSLMYASTPKESHLLLIKRVMRYLLGTMKLGLFYRASTSLNLRVYTDSDYAGDSDERRSTSGYVFLINSTAVSWCSKKQPIVALSTTEAEFVAAASCVCQGIWMQRILKELGHPVQKKLEVLCDNSSTIKLSVNPVLHGRCKHIEVRYHFLRILSRKGRLELVYCKSQEQIADIMTKGLKLATFEVLRNMLGVAEVPIN